jgi:anti-sigma factor RsiW
MDCQRTVEKLSDYIDGTLGSRHSMQVRDHLTDCPHCREEYESLRKLRTLLGALPPPRPRRDFWAGAFEQVGIQEAAPRWRERVRIPAWLSLRARFAESVAPRAALFATTGVALLLLAALTLPLSLRRETAAAPTAGTRPARTEPSAPIMLADAISADALISLHSQHSVGLPLADTGRMRYLNNELRQADLEADEALDIH